MHSLVLVAKLPRQGITKTRLQLSGESSVLLARAFLLDVLRNHKDIACTEKVFYFAPAEAETEARRLLRENDLSASWTILPILSSNLGSSDLSSILTELVYSRAMQGKTITLIGSDCPDLPVEEALKGQEIALLGEAYILPACDGGYVLLSLPAGVPPGAFEQVRWSAENTAVTQILALRRIGVCVRVGRTYTDVDTPDDLRQLQLVCSGDKESSRRCTETIAALKKV